MFTGIVEETGKVMELKRVAKGARLVLEVSKVATRTRVGDSISVNGCCLTVVSMARRPVGSGGGRGRRTFQLSFDLLEETLKRTNLGSLVPGDAVNLERALRAGTPLGGHWVTGHVDGVGVIRKLAASGEEHVLEMDVPPWFRKWVVPKGSVTVDGISLTVAKILPKGFRIWIIPHTWSVTRLNHCRKGDCLNLEADIIGKYVLQYGERFGFRRNSSST